MKALLFFLLMVVASTSQAQTWNEFFKQKRTQRKYLLQQIVALKVYSGYLSKGYSIANKGLKTIKGFTKGEFNLHSDFINSLKAVNPIIAKSKRISEIVLWQKAIIDAFNSLNIISSTSDRAYLESVEVKVLSECEHDISQVLLLITAGNLEMKDDERIQRIEDIHKSMLEKFRFTKSFVGEMKLLDVQRKQEERNVKTAQELNQLTK